MRGDEEPEPSEYHKVERFNFKVDRMKATPLRDQTSEASSYMIISNPKDEFRSKLKK